MDIVSHGLWGGLLAKAVNRKIRMGGKTKTRRWDPLLAGFWGVFPDLVAFTPVFLLFSGGVISGHMDLEHVPRPHDAEPFAPDTLPIFRLTALMYSMTHSAVMFTAVFLSVWVFRRFVLHRRGRAPVWEMGGWLFHILMDLFTHSYRFYPTPILWPFSSWHFDGVPWSTPWLFTLNWVVLLAGYMILRRRKDMPEVPEPALAFAEERYHKRR